MSAKISLRTILIYPACLAMMALSIVPGCGKVPQVEVPEDAEETEVVSEAPEETSGAVILDATLAAQNGRYTQAREMLEQVLERDPADLEALRLLARVYSAQGDPESSARTWEKVSALDPGDPDAAYEAGVALSRAEKWRELYSKMSGIEALGRADARHHLLLGEAGLELGHYDEAERYLKKAGEVELASVLLGRLYYRRGNLDAAEEAFRKTLEMDRDDYEANLHLGYISYSRGRKSAALKYYSRAHRADPSAPLPCLSVASLYEKMGSSSDAVEWYRKALGLKRTARSERRKVYLSLMKILVQEGRLAEAAETASRGTEEFPSAGGLYYYWGEALLGQGDRTGAREKFKTAADDPAWRKHALERFHSIG